MAMVAEGSPFAVLSSWLCVILSALVQLVANASDATKSLTVPRISLLRPMFSGPCSARIAVTAWPGASV